VSESGSVLIVGCGIIGLLWHYTLKRYGIHRITVTEKQPDRLKTGIKLGLNIYTPEDLKQKDNLFDNIIDCSGNPAAIEHAFSLLKPLGKFLFFGMCPQDATLRINPFSIFQKELTLIGSVINPFTFSRAAELIQQLEISPEEMGVAKFPLEKYQEALQAAKSGSVTKVFFSPAGDYS
jgi:threonine dehydrogenase-like Zn-dependent dehydrogenase